MSALPSNGTCVNTTGSERTLGAVERDLARDALADEQAKRLMTIPGIHMVVAIGIMAAIGPIERFASPQHLVSYFGLNPSVHQSGDGPAHHGRITKRGRGHARGMLVEAAWVAARVPGSTTRLLFADPRPPWSARGGCRRCPQARSPDLAHAAKQ